MITLSINRILAQTGKGVKYIVPQLNVSAGRGSGGFAITSRESRDFTNCDATVLDDGSREWFASIPGTLRPSATLSIDWRDFKNAGESMPAYIGLGRKYFIVSCRDADNIRFSSGVAFSK